MGRRFGKSPDHQADYQIVGVVAQVGRELGKDLPLLDGPDDTLAVFRLEGAQVENVTAKARAGEALPMARYLVVAHETVTSPLLLGSQFIVWGGPQFRAYDVESGRQLWTNTARGSNASSLYSLRVGDDLVAYQVKSLPAQQNLAAACVFLQSLGEIHGIPDCGEIHLLVCADIPDDRVTRVNSNAKIEAQFRCDVYR